MVLGRTQSRRVLQTFLATRGKPALVPVLRSGVEGLDHCAAFLPPDLGGWCRPTPRPLTWRFGVLASVSLEWVSSRPEPGSPKPGAQIRGCVYTYTHTCRQGPPHSHPRFTPPASSARFQAPLFPLREG